MLKDYFLEDGTGEFSRTFYSGMTFGLIEEQFIFDGKLAGNVVYGINYMGGFYKLPPEGNGIYYEIIEDENDNVNQPNHYTAGKYEVIDVIEDRVERLPGKEAFLVANITKYISRYDLKNGVEDLKKARFYLDRLINVKEEME